MIAPIPRDDIVRRYRHLADVYDRRWRRYNEQTLHSLLDVLPLSGTERILDVGCGTGEFERLALARFPRVRFTGVDVTPAMVAQAQRKLCDTPQVTWCIAQAEHLPFTDEHFDVVVCGNVLHHVRDTAQFAQECARVLRAAGRLVLVDWCRDFWHCRLFHYWLRIVDRSYVRMYGLAELARVMEPRGLVVEDSSRFLAPPLYGMLRVVARKGS